MTATRAPRHATITACVRHLFPATALVFITLGALSLCGCPAADYEIASTTCLACHDGRSAPDKTGFLDGVHRSLECTDCHHDGYTAFMHVRVGGRNGRYIYNPGEDDFAVRDDVCASCHVGYVSVFHESPHFLNEAASCHDCHDVHSRGGMVVDVASPDDVGTDELAAICGRCHEGQVADTALSRHGASGIADCLTCHNPHSSVGFAEDVASNTLCTQCHGFLGLETDEDLVNHAGPWHPADPAGSGSGRCTACHMVPTQYAGQPLVPLGHTMNPVPPQVTLDAIANGDAAVPPNSCAGVMGCHDPNVPGSGLPRDLFDVELGEDLQDVYRLTTERPWS